MPTPSNGPPSDKKGLLLAVPLVACCGLPILIVAAAALGAALVGPIVGGIVLAGVIGYFVMRRGRIRASCACAVPEERAFRNEVRIEEPHRTVDGSAASPAPPLNGRAGAGRAPVRRS